MVDQRAVTEAMKALGRKSKTLREGMTAAIEAYEAAKPDPWRRLAAIKDCRLGRVLVWVPIDDDNDRLFIDSVSGGDADRLQWDEYASRLENVGAMFRTIGTPPQDAISRATSTPPAAEASS